MLLNGRDLGMLERAWGVQAMGVARGARGVDRGQSGISAEDVMLIFFVILLFVLAVLVCICFP